MTPIEKYKDIDLSKLPEKAVEKVKEIAKYLNDTKLKNSTDADSKEAYKVAEKSMEALYSNISQKYPESIKSKVAKAPEPKTPQAMAKKIAQASVVQPKKGKSTASAKPTDRGNITKLAKEIYKKGEEKWTDAVKRAGQMIKAQKTKAVKNANTQYKKLQEFLAKNPTLNSATVVSGSKGNWQTKPLDKERDASRKAKAPGKRISKEGNTYYEYRENRVDRFGRSKYPYLKLGGMLHGAGTFEDGGIIDPDKLYAQLNEAEKNYSKDNGAEYNRIMGLIAENRKNYYAALNHAEENFSKDNGAEYNRLYKMREKFAHGGYVEEGEDYEYVNTFGIDQKDFEKMVDYYHTNTYSKENVYKSMVKKYGQAKALEVMTYIDKTHKAHNENYAKGGGVDIKLKIISSIDKFDRYYDEVGFNKKELSLPKQDNHKNYYVTTKDSGIAEQLIEDGYVVKYAKGGMFGAGNFAKGGKLKTPTNKEVCDNGEIIEEDISDKRNIMESVIEYNNEIYLVNTKYVAHGKNKKSLQPTQPNRTAKKLVEPDKDGNYVVEFYGENRKKPVISKTFTTFKSAIKFAANQDSWNDETYDFDIIVYGNSGKILSKKYFSAIGIYDEDEDKYDEFLEKVKSMKGVSNIEVTVGVSEYRRKKIATHNFKTIKEAEQFIIDIAYEGRLDAYIHDIPIDLIMNIYDLSDMDIYAKGGKLKTPTKKEKYSNGGVIPNQRTHIKFNDYLATAYAEGFEEAPSNNAVIEAWAYLIATKLAYQMQGWFGRTANQLIEQGAIAKDGTINWDMIDNSSDEYAHGGMFGAGHFAKGGKLKGKLSSKYNYVPNYMIQEVEVERKGKTTFIDAANILDGVYVKKGVKYAKGGELTHLMPKIKTHRNDER